MSWNGRVNKNCLLPREWVGLLVTEDQTSGQRYSTAGADKEALSGHGADLNGGCYRGRFFFKALRTRAQTQKPTSSGKSAQTRPRECPILLVLSFYADAEVTRRLV